MFGFALSPNRFIMKWSIKPLLMGIFYCWLYDCIWQQGELLNVGLKGEKTLCGEWNLYHLCRSFFLAIRLRIVSNYKTINTNSLEENLLGHQPRLDYSTNTPFCLEFNVFYGAFTNQSKKEILHGKLLLDGLSVLFYLLHWAKQPGTRTC